ncbi:hypothetical protein B1772_05635 [Dehalococcoides mccartyi]|uniref:hypothetical protein n=1 Tax=Dehalococcoides mccartyi TaxID=61435 RepID=UPI00099BE6C7|nr:hypothetical protein [Dehalococcoides mccartyi]AQX74964.1 hypothetical protein B1776_05325 [Dehalococcoides mccartyi]AQY73540.1 hypothetical protein B1772_05635 [Dehalococcoides mccartyi]
MNSGVDMINNISPESRMTRNGYLAILGNAGISIDRINPRGYVLRVNNKNEELPKCSGHEYLNEPECFGIQVLSGTCKYRLVNIKGQTSITGMPVIGNAVISPAGITFPESQASTVRGDYREYQIILHKITVGGIFSCPEKRVTTECNAELFNPIGPIGLRVNNKQNREVFPEDWQAEICRRYFDTAKADSYDLAEGEFVTCEGGLLTLKIAQHRIFLQGTVYIQSTLRGVSGYNRFGNN